ncbi:MAG: hypothetical protein K0S16_1037 [Moraxellaceae bacterium]|nr:hypothetical protein [Moraxellaceae bacterium]
MQASTVRIHIGCAGWSLPRATWPQFPAEGTHLVRYAARFSAVEINSSFYRPHRPETYARWAAGTPADFRFSVKLPRRITHEQRLHDCGPLLDTFLAEAGALGDRFGVLLVQLPPSLAFAPAVAASFLQALRAGFSGKVAWEPRHPSWFAATATELLQEFRIARVAADPAPVPAAAQPAAWPGFAYFRLHGSPRMYYSAYAPAALEALAQELQRRQSRGQEVWCIFDNTAEGAAVPDALHLLQRLGEP